MSEKKFQIGVIGGREASAADLCNAHQTGQLIARKDAVLLCGGMGGIMEAACKGAKEAGGTTVGILPTDSHSHGNAYLDIVIPTNLGIARNAVLVCACHGVIAIGGQYGTLSEIAYALQFGIPVVSLNSWDISQDVYQSNSPEESIHYIFNQLG